MNADYEVLGLDPNLQHDKAAIRKAYRKRCLACHPDKHGSAEEFIALTAAYNRLIVSEGSAEKDAEVDMTTLMIDFLQSYILHLLSTAIAPKGAAASHAKPPPVRINISVALSEVYFCQTKKVVVKVARSGSTYERVPFYIVLDIDDFSVDASGCHMECVFEGKGDQGENETYGDVIIRVCVGAGAGAATSDSFEAVATQEGIDLACHVWVPLHEYIRGTTVTLKHLSGEELVVAAVPIREDVVRIDNQGFDKSGKLHVYFHADLSGLESLSEASVANLRDAQQNVRPKIEGRPRPKGT